jgi:signal transduction histidine kinase
VSVVDSGPGIAPELVTEVFTHGYTTKAARAGERGIGLALTRLICQRRGGEVEVESTPTGAKFVARLTVEPGPGPATALTDDSTETVAVVEEKR